ncbi:MAG: TetR/AcrR family transcriptional regulator [Streptosporangiaceae bacterium]|jgi:AcrR family transcriptional regulator
MAHHGWGGRPPASATEARQRIVDATARCIDQYGVAKTTLSDVANELGVTRQTVYRHFARVSDIISEVAAQGAESFVDRMLEHLEGVASPSEAVVEGIIYCVRTIPTDPQMSLLLQAGDSAAFGRGVTARDALRYGSQVLRRFPVDWASAGVGEDELDGLAEMIMRTFTSLLQHPGSDEPDDDELRGWLNRWIAPALAAGRAL